MAVDEESGSDSDDDDEVQMNSLGLAISLCDSLRNNAFLGAWEDSAARNKWKQALCKPGNTLAQFGQHIKTFESKLAQSAMSSRYANARPSLHAALAEVRDEVKILDHLPTAQITIQFTSQTLQDLSTCDHSMRATCGLPSLMALEEIFETAKQVQITHTSHDSDARGYLSDARGWLLFLLQAHARLCVQLLAGNINPILFKSEQQRAMCAGPFAPSTAKQ